MARRVCCVQLTRAAVWSIVAGLWVCTLAPGAAARADAEGALPSPLRLADVLRYARAHRAEIRAADARARAAAERPDAVSALEDPVISPALNHLPYSLKGANWSVTVQQRFRCRARSASASVRPRRSSRVRRASASAWRWTWKRAPPRPI